jgi:predicted dehydrogenase
MRLACVGCGDAAKAINLASRFVSGVEMTVFVDAARDRAESMADRHRGARAETDWRTLADDPAVDAVYVAVPHSLHREVVGELSAAGKPVLLEKPLAESVASGAELLSALPAGAKVGVNYQYRYDPKAWALVTAVRSGSVGSVHYISVDVPWYRTPAYFDHASWHAQAQVAGGGTLLTQGSHLLDIALLCAGSVPVAASGQTYRRQFVESEVEDLASGQLETSSGIPIFISSSMVSPPGFRASIAVYGSRGCIRYEGPGRASLRGYGVRVPRPVVFTQLHSYRASLSGFKKWVNGGELYRCTAGDAMPVLRAVDAIYRSAGSGARVVIE